MKDLSVAKMQARVFCRAIEGEVDNDSKKLNDIIQKMKRKTGEKIVKTTLKK